MNYAKGNAFAIPFWLTLLRLINLPRKGPSSQQGGKADAPRQPDFADCRFFFESAAIFNRQSAM
jgi:hypothetical protein